MCAANIPIDSVRMFQVRAKAELKRELLNAYLWLLLGILFRLPTISLDKQSSVQPEKVANSLRNGNCNDNSVADHSTDSQGHR
jgi:hypothetical protein